MTSKLQSDVGDRVATAIGAMVDAGDLAGAFGMGVAVVLEPEKAPATPCGGGVGAVG